VLLTGTTRTSLDLHDLVQATQGRHAGIRVVCAENNPTRDMKDHHIVRALVNLQAAGVPIQNEFYVLNHWR